MTRSIQRRLQSLEQVASPISYEVFQDEEELELYHAWKAKQPKETNPGITYLMVDGVPRSQDEPTPPWCKSGEPR